MISKVKFKPDDTLGSVPNIILDDILHNNPIQRNIPSREHLLLHHLLPHKTLKYVLLLRSYSRQ